MDISPPPRDSSNSTTVALVLVLGQAALMAAGAVMLVSISREGDFAGLAIFPAILLTLLAPLVAILALRIRLRGRWIARLSLGLLECLLVYGAALVERMEGSPLAALVLASAAATIMALAWPLRPDRR